VRNEVTAYLQSCPVYIIACVYTVDILWRKSALMRFIWRRHCIQLPQTCPNIGGGGGTSQEPRGRGRFIQHGDWQAAGCAAAAAAAAVDERSWEHRKAHIVIGNAARVRLATRTAVISPTRTTSPQVVCGTNKACN